ncbi:hypothetical protein KO500_14830 [Cellulophaga baltica]|uniref:hypothetical protein n=1 Tax=Cellulophaga TaxID=104264 RepID=UPI001C073F1F|nr:MULTISPECIES: hypothetical protein [Cellulophaga]MBU2997722.1 hypothetical protein [Cellulophaga baltica]MDO6769117.1 hypothetical protein [Cellulophaga sp. 1_MG-2023]
MRKPLIITMVTLMLSTTVVTLNSCREEKSTGDKIEEAADDVGDGIEEGAEEVEDEIDDHTNE